MVGQLVLVSISDMQVARFLAQLAETRQLPNQLFVITGQSLQVKPCFLES